MGNFFHSFFQMSTVDKSPSSARIRHVFCIYFVPKYLPNRKEESEEWPLIPNLSKNKAAKPDNN